jgi:hypothetical protein
MNDGRADKHNNAAGIVRSVLVAAALMVAPAKHPLIVIEVETLHWTSAQTEVERGAPSLIWHASQDCKTIRHSGETET